MSNDTTPPVRDNSGRFVKTAAEKVNAMSRTPDDGIHPMSRILFGWTQAKGIGGIIFWGMAGLSIVLVLLDLVIPRHEKIGIANSVGFYGLWGFAAFSFVVLMGWPLGRLLRRGLRMVGGPHLRPSGRRPQTPRRAPRGRSTRRTSCCS